MPRVPDYNSNIPTVVPDAPMPHFAPAVREAFGQDVQLANARIGEQGQGIGKALMDYGIEQKKLKDSAATADLDTNFRKTLQNQLLSEETEKVNINGVDVERPVGVLNRTLKQADGSTVDFDKYYQSAKSAFMAAAPSKEEADKLGATMDNHYLTARDNVIAHEAKQNKNVLIQSQTSNLAQQVHDAAAINHPIDLLDAINKATATQSQINDLTGVDPETAAKNLKDKAGDVVSKSVSATLMATGDLDKAQQLLDVAKEDIHPDRYEKLSEMLVSGSERLDRQQERLEVKKNVDYQADILTKWANGEMSWMNLDDITRDVERGNADPKFGAAMADVLAAQERDEDYSPTDKNENYPKWIESVYTAESQEDLHKSLVKAMKDYKNLSQDRLAVLINAALKRGKELPLRTNDLDPGQGKKVNIAQTEEDAGAKAVLYFGRSNGMSSQDISYIYQNYANGLEAGKSPMESYAQAVKANAVAQFPDSVNYEEPPNFILTPDSPIRVIFPKGVSTNKESKEKKTKPKTSGGDHQK